MGLTIRGWLLDAVGELLAGILILVRMLRCITRLLWIDWYLWMVIVW